MSNPIGGLIMLACTISANAQQVVTCAGTILDDSGEALMGANVMIKGTQNGTITDLDGRFSLSNCEIGDTLEVSFVGYVTYKYCINSGNNSNIKIQLCDESFGDVSAACYGSPCSSGGTKLPCNACETAATDWEPTGTPGYESRLAGGTCSGNTSTSHGVCTGQTTQYRCADGYQGTTTDGKTGCIRVPTCATGCCGTVVMEYDGMPLIGASVVLMKPTTPLNGYAGGVVTDIDGVYQLDSCEPGDKLIVVFIGLARQEITITNQNKSGILISMLDDYGEGSCDVGYYMDWSTGQSVCQECPYYGQTPGFIPASNSGKYDNTIYYCRIPAATSLNDETGEYTYTSDCYYGN